MAARTSEEVIARARARFDDGEHRAAWDSLLVMARREPEVMAYRDALSEFYRRAEHPDQAARWGAHDIGSLTHQEVRALRRSLQQFQMEKEVRKYLVLPDELPLEVTVLLRSPRQQRLIRWERSAETWEFTAGILATFFGAPLLAGGVIIILVQAFIGDPDVHSAAQMMAALVLGLTVSVGTLLLVACLLRRRWVRSALLVLLVGFSIAVLSQADMTVPLPFG